MNKSTKLCGLMGEKMKKVILAILDGVGLSEQTIGNAVALSKPKFLSQLNKKYSCVALEASGKDVGLPEGQMGNSEVGHSNIGAGRIVLQKLKYIDSLIESGEFEKNERLRKMMLDAQNRNGILHLLCLASDGGVHSSIEHLFATLKMAKKYKFKKIWLHLFTDGRDTEPSVAMKYLEQVEKALGRSSKAEIATICGRFFAMDREKNWKRTASAFNAICSAKGKRYQNYKDFFCSDGTKAIQDEFVEPMIVNDEYQGVKSGDALFFVNFRADRTRQLVRAFCERELDMARGELPSVSIWTMTDYGRRINNLGAKVVFADLPLEMTLTEVVCNNAQRVLKVAETTKYAHVTYFFNGGREQPFLGEKRILVNSAQVSSFDKKPKMKAKKIRKALIKELKLYDYGLAVVNFANGDMVGHSGNLKATIKAMKCVDKQLKKIYDFAKRYAYTLCITSDHGNAEKMIDEFGQKWTAHTLNKVPFVICDKKVKLKDGKYELGNIAPTILDYCDLKKPKAMRCVSMLDKSSE